MRDPSAFKDETGVPPVSSFCHALGMLAKYLLVREVEKFESSDVYNCGWVFYQMLDESTNEDRGISNHSKYYLGKISSMPGLR